VLSVTRRTADLLSKQKEDNWPKSRAAVLKDLFGGYFRGANLEGA